MSDQAALIDTLRRITGASHVLTGGDLTAYEQDWRKRARGKALAVARPGNTQEVAAIVKVCAAAGVSIVTQGGNTGLVVGGIPDESGRQLVLSLQRMNAVRDIDAANMTVTAEAGCILQTLQEAAEKAGFLFPLSLAAEGSCTIGGNLATNAGGTQVVRYGNARDLCLGLEVVTAQGDIWNGLTGLRKDNTGYDLRDLFIGSEGTLGIITAATLKLYPQPVARLTAWAAVPSMQHAVALLGLAHRHLGAGLTGFEVMGQFALSLVAKNFKQMRVPFLEAPAAAPGRPKRSTAPSGGSVGAPFCVLLENSDQESEGHAREQFERLLETAMNEGCVLDAVVAENITQANQLWHIRETIPLAQAEEGLNIKHDISIAVSRIPEFVDVTDALLVAALPGIRLVNFGHLGDGNLHYNVQAPAGADGAAFLRDHEEQVNALVYDSVMRFGGSISAEHGVGSLKLDKLEQHKSPVALGIMRAVKQALDPENLMNPGRVLRV
ncbi:MAG: hydroxyacid dehydrogenase [Polaromonas sp. 39-63-203]|jgi:FAD/FMN-containing dehydrogenase|uniref:FAD-binding oxidoreductase n=1 Tax=Polaromonas sp. TaxID=1869339 RepID=UPI000BCC9DD9|nr:FAD-binding oxidoreductase [Polaromonas sp.]OYY53325.1 MAG: hydroxyacid dehydrogenase [Polaromonas sp. 35-63-240]OYY99932.1 MAG: hydroxyacid dehydrogenase [Polaromonas sp. 28-63-22]OYZ84459.1 MAG: hydroxyacid dehydrogenase [Polaromonas sp. 24-62-144]OZA97626.1 MAG: hydroxyacid dehydrogenase [Polaromonas sp. 39-63-203]HQS32334.1 FAD-binding oxidoreductase [Polaromonas sp.]